MDPAEYRALVAEINQHNTAYYVNSTPTISDFEYDMLYRRLREVEEAHPEWIDENSPTRKVGGAVLSEFKPFVHKDRMLSLDNTYNEGEMRDFMGRISEGAGGEEVEMVAEPKVDGVAIKLRFENGILVQAGTRGNGDEGEDVTENVKTIKTLPLRVQDAPPELEVIGEVFMTFAGFEKINKAREEAGENLFANPRNAAAGTLKSLDSAEVAKRPLSILVYGVTSPVLEKHTDAIALLRSLSMPVPEWSAVCKTADELWTAIGEMDELRRKLPYPTDGVVAKVNSLELREEIGTTAKIPRWAFSYKFAPEQAQTRILDITFQVGRTGVITPVAELEPVSLSGSTISRVTLHNFSDLGKKGIQYGDTIIIEKGGEVIPRVASVVMDKRPETSTPIVPPTDCPCCSGKVAFNGTFAHCEAPDCEAQLTRRIEHFASKGAMDIDGMGEVVVQQLVDSKLVSSIGDIYSLTREKLLTLDRMGERKADSLLKGIEASKKQPVSRLLFALGILNVGVSTGKKLERRFGSLDAVAAATEEQLLSIDDIGPVGAKSILTFMQSPSFPTLRDQLKAAGVNLGVEKTGADLADSGPFVGKTFVITGTLPVPEGAKGSSRQYFTDLIESLGGKVSGSVSKNTHFLLAGDKAGSKLKEAAKHGVPVLDLDTFTSMAASTPAPAVTAQPVASPVIAPQVSAPTPIPEPVSTPQEPSCRVEAEVQPSIALPRDPAFANMTATAPVTQVKQGFFDF